MTTRPLRCVDAVMYAHEPEALAIRWHELDAVVDRFVVVEATASFQGTEKPLHLLEDIRDRPELDLERFLPRLALYTLGAWASTAQTPWDREANQRNAVTAGLDGVPDDALVLLCDADEVPRAETVAQLQDILPQDGLARLGGPAYLYYLNAQEFTYPAWYGPHVVRRGRLYRDTPQALRGYAQGNRAGPGALQRSAWHFSFLGGRERILEKLGWWSHDEDNVFASPENVDAALAGLRDWKQDRRPQLTLRPVPLDASFPAWVLKETAVFAPYLVPPEVARRAS